jgi:HAD superfamily hydrolase (TIGR01509 family)
MATIRGLLLDIDGTLVDSNDAHAHSWVAALAEHGIKVPFEKVRKLIGKGGDKLLPEVSGIGADAREGKQLTRRHVEIFKERYLPRLRPTPGAPELLRHLREKGLKLVAATSAQEDIVGPLLRICGAADLIKGKTSSDDVSHSKPDPDIVQAALGEASLPPSQVVLLGDTPYDIEAAARSGVGVIALRCGGWGDPDLEGALAVYEDPADLLAHYDSSPLGGGG